VTATSSPLCLLRWAAHTAEGPTLPVHEQQACRAWSLEAAEEVDNRFLWQIHIFEGSNGTAAAAGEGVEGADHLFLWQTHLFACRNGVADAVEGVDDLLMWQLHFFVCRDETANAVEGVKDLILC
jgi:hypothetical protein